MTVVLFRPTSDALAVETRRVWRPARSQPRHGPVHETRTLLAHPNENPHRRVSDRRRIQDYALRAPRALALSNVAATRERPRSALVVLDRRVEDIIDVIEALRTSD